MSNLEEMNEEFNNFMHKVTQVSDILKKMNSDDKDLQRIADLEARQYLGEDKMIDDENCDIQVKNDRTVINKSAINTNDNAEAQSKESFMDEVSKDADRRYKQKLIRKEKMETFRKQATLAFRRGEYEKALSLYNKSIELIRDSCILYCNRALTLINLKLYKQAMEDCDNALRLNENSLRARLLLAKAKFLDGDVEGCEDITEEAKTKHEEDLDFIEDFIKSLKDNKRQ